MHAVNPAQPRCLPSWQNALIWLGLFLSPSIYVFLLLTLASLEVPAPREEVVAGLFYAIPVAALVACGTLIWLSQLSTGWRVTGILLTTLGILLQCGFWLFLAIVISSAIALP